MEPDCGPLCCLSALLLLTEHWVWVDNWGVLAACSQGGCILILSSRALFFLPFKLLLNEVNDFAPGNASIKPQALHGHRPCLHVSFHVPVLLPSILDLSSCKSLAGRERRREDLSAVQHRAVGE